MLFRSSVVVSNLDGGTWSTLAASTPMQFGDFAGTVACDRGERPIVAWTYPPGPGLPGNRTLLLQAWSGSAWYGLGGSDTNFASGLASGYITNLQLFVDSKNRPILTWSDYNNSEYSVLRYEPN